MKYLNKNFLLKNKFYLLGGGALALLITLILTPYFGKMDECAFVACGTKCTNLPSGYISAGNPDNYKYEDCLAYWCYGGGADILNAEYLSCLQQQEQQEQEQEQQQQNSNQQTEPVDLQQKCVTPTDQCNLDCSQYIDTPAAYSICVDGCNSEVTQDCWDTYNKCVLDKQKQQKSITGQTNQQNSGNKKTTTPKTNTKKTTAKKPSYCVGTIKPVAMVPFTGSQLEGKNGSKIMTDEAFIPVLNKVNQLAADNDLRLIITDSYSSPETKVQGVGDVKRVTKSNHNVGHAIDFKVKYYVTEVDPTSGITSKYEQICDYDCLMKYPNVPQDVKNFIDALRKLAKSKFLRWGGDFKTTPKDPIHIDDGMNLFKPKQFNQLYKNVNCPKNATNK